MLSSSGSSCIAEHSGGFPTDSPADSMRIMRMKTRVAVRDKTPHRFQVVPLRDVDKHGTRQPEIPQWSASSHSKNNAQRKSSGKLGLYSQSKQFLLSSSNQPLLGLPSNDDSRELDGTSWELNVNDTLTTTYDKHLTASHSVMPSLNLQHGVSKPVLAEWDMNQERPIPRLTPSAPTESKTNSQSGCAKPSPYQSTMIASIQTELTPNHTKSQSLRITSLAKGNYPRFASLSQPSHDILEILPGAPLSGFENLKPPVEAKYRNFTETVASTKEESEFREVNNFLPSNRNQQSLRAKSRRRHAIYTESLYVPFLDQGCDSHSREITPKSCFSDSYTGFAQAMGTKNLDFANASCLQPPDLGFSSEHDLQVANQASFTFTTVSSNLFPSNRAPLLPTSRVRPPTLIEPRGLHYPTNKPSRIRLLSEKDISRSEIVYPCIVLDLFAEINLAIEQWKPIV